MQVLTLEPGDLLQVKSTDLPSGSFIKLQAQATSFLDISDPKAVLENVFRNYSCLTTGDIFTFEYNDQTFDMAVLEVKPDTEKHAIVVLETDLEVDFATPLGYDEEQARLKAANAAKSKSGSGTSTPGSTSGAYGLPSSGLLHSQGSMAHAINYASIAPEAAEAAAGAKAVSSNFLLGGQKLSSKRGSKAPTPKPSTPVAGVSSNQGPTKQVPPLAVRKRNGPQPLRLPPGKLFFGYAIKPLRKEGPSAPGDEGGKEKPKFLGQGQTLRGKKKDG